MAATVWFAAKSRKTVTTAAELRLIRKNLLVRSRPL